MRIGIISDIHGDYDTLMVTLDRLDHYHAVDHILCAGDLIGRGPAQDRVVEVVKERAIPTVRGNHDEWLGDLNQANSAYLKYLPLDWEADIHGVHMYMCHGKPGNNMWGMYRDHLSKTYLNMVLRSLKTDVLVTGHTHVPLYMRVKAGVIINPGSLYTFESSRATSHTYGVLHLPELKFVLWDATTSTSRPVRLDLGSVA